MSFVVAPVALAEIKAVAAYIRRDNPPAARRFRQQLYAKFSLLARRPQTFRLRTEFGADIRVAHSGAYLIFFRIQDEGVHILRVIHGARDLAESLKDNPS